MIDHVSTQRPIPIIDNSVASIELQGVRFSARQEPTIQKSLQQEARACRTRDTLHALGVSTCEPVAVHVAPYYYIASRGLALGLLHHGQNYSAHFCRNRPLFISEIAARAF